MKYKITGLRKIHHSDSTGQYPSHNKQLGNALTLAIFEPEHMEEE